MATGPLPQWRVINGEKYVLRLLQIATRKPNGTPDVVKLLEDSDSVGIRGGEEFITCYVHERSLSKERDE